MPPDLPTFLMNHTWLPPLVPTPFFYLNMPGLLYPYILSHYTWVPPPTPIFTLYIYLMQLTSKSYTVYNCILAERKTQNENDESMGSAYAHLTAIYINHHFDTNLKESAYQLIKKKIYMEIKNTPGRAYQHFNELNKLMAEYPKPTATMKPPGILLFATLNTFMITVLSTER